MSLKGFLVGLTLMAGITGVSHAELFNDGTRDAVRANTADADQPYLVDTGARLVLPSLGMDRSPSIGDKIYIQFKRPLNAGERAELVAAGIVFYRTLAPFTFLAQVPESATGTLAGHPLFLGWEPVLAADKTTATLYRDQIPYHARRGQDRIAVSIRFYRDVPFAQAFKMLASMGIDVGDQTAYLFGNQLEVEVTQEQALGAAASPLVRAVSEVAPEPETDNQTAAALSFVTIVNNFPWSLTGTGVNLGIWDGGAVRNTHNDLTGRVTLRETTRFCASTTNNRSGTNTTCTQNSNCASNFCNPFSDHASHVAGTMISSGANDSPSKGMAPGPAQVFSYNYLGSINTEMENSVANDAIHLSQNSWGIGRGWQGSPPVNNGDGAQFGVYNSLSSGWDELVRDTELLIMKSAGNEGNDCQTGGTPSNPSSQCDGVLGSPSDGFRYDIISDRDLAKNIITVGSVDTSFTKSVFSSTGPPDDGRIKPDLVAVGSNTRSTCSLSNSDYCTKSGTSMSTPVVSGVSALLTERWQDFHTHSGRSPNAPPPELTKALLIHGATDLGRTGPDYAYGHGLVNAVTSVTTLEAPNAGDSSNQVPDQHRIGFVDSGEVVEYRMSIPTGEETDDIRVTLVWSDIEGTSGSVVRYCNYAYGASVCTSDADCPGAVCEPAPCGAGQPCHLQNDLAALLLSPEPDRDIVGLAYRGPGLANPTGASLVGSFHNRSDSVEVIRPGTFDDGGDYIVTVEGMTVNQGPQRFALVASYPLTFFPPNDDFANAQQLPMLVPPDPLKDDCLTGESPCPATQYPHNRWEAVNFDATQETNEPKATASQEHSVWFRWTPTQSGFARFDTTGAVFDTTLGVYTGTSVDALTELDKNDDSYGRQSRVDFDAVSGTDYFIAVGGYESSFKDESMGLFPLNYHLVPSVCGNGNQEPGEACDDGNLNNGDCCSSSCQFEPSGSSCNDDGSLCTVDQCDGAGACVFDSLLSCDDGNACTDDSCDPLSGCAVVNNTNSCNDGLDCTTGDACSGGSCVGGPPPNCDDSNACTSDSCQEGWSCVNAPQQVLVLQQQTVTTPMTYTAAQHIEIGNGFIAGPGADLDLMAPLFTATPGFNVQVGAIVAFGNGGNCPANPPCSHDVCFTGVALDPNCSACASAICAADPYCCNTEWDSLCTGAVPSVCNQECSAPPASASADSSILEISRRHRSDWRP